MEQFPFHKPCKQIFQPRKMLFQDLTSNQNITKRHKRSETNKSVIIPVCNNVRKNLNFDQNPKLYISSNNISVESNDQNKHVPEKQQFPLVSVRSNTQNSQRSITNKSPQNLLIFNNIATQKIPITKEQSPIRDSCNQFSIYFKQKNHESIIDQIKIGTQESYLNRNFEGYKESEEQYDPKNFLEKHPINSQMRAKMIDWIIEVMSQYQCTDNTFFLAVNIMDRFFWKNKELCQVEDLHLIGVVSMFIACKYEEIIPLRLKTIQEKIAHGKLSMQQIKQKEAEIANVLDCKFSGATLINYITISLQKIQNLKLIEEVDTLSFLNKVSLYMAKMVCYDYELLNNFSQRALAGAAIYVSLKLLEQFLQKNEIPQIIEQIREFLELSNSDIVQSATHLLYIARTFDQIYPYLKNLSYFNQDLLVELQTKKNILEKAQNTQRETLQQA